VAQGLRAARGDLIGAAAANTGKVFTESDPEVSEAIDFVEYYPRSLETFTGRSHLQIEAKGVGVVVSPWNFPIAIACGGISAALAAGNTVVFKPSSQAVLVAWQLCGIFWSAGVSRNTLQFLPCNGAEEGALLIAHPDVDFVILTGGTATGQAMLGLRPDLFLAAETGGKNATIVTAMADRDQAIAHVIHSAFGHGGQKCSATSLLILEKEVYDDAGFQKTLVDAAQSLSVGSAWQFRNTFGPLIQPPAGVLLRGLTQLEPGESWALQPCAMGGNPHVWRPGIKWNVSPGSFTHRTELFGPVLGVMRAQNLDEAIDLANQTGYGLTAAIESLDPREIARWQAGIRAGNLYINRGTTGAVVLRQPFGGLGLSAIGPAIKAGGPNYVTQFVRLRETAPPPLTAIPTPEALLKLAQEWEAGCRWGRLRAWQEDLLKSAQAVRSYLFNAQTEFYVDHDYFHLRGQDNLLRHLPVGRVAVCLHPDDRLFEVVARLAAALAARCRVILTKPKGMVNEATDFLATAPGRGLLSLVSEIVDHADEDVLESLPHVDRLRYAAPNRVPRTTYAQAAKRGIYIAREPVMMDGRIELLRYLLSQSICHTYHRYGNLGERGI
jgi:RHH-type proline utilization regulon transcriptional repressor/proline dehydrogenase/delta 1-pyrroline-5-carboxylate dehydrogenase